MNIYCKQALTGGISGCLDAIDGSLLSDGDRALVITPSLTYHYILDADSGLAESSPDVIAPDTNPGNKRWIIVTDINSSVPEPSGASGTVDTYQTYYPDPSKADQGALSGETNKTIKDIVTNLGTNKYAKIVLRHTGSGSYTNYAFDTSLSLAAYPNIFIEFEPGARVSRVTGNEYFTIYSPGHVITPGANVINTDYTLMFAYGGTTYPEWYGAVGDGSTDDTWAIQRAIAALPPATGGVVEFATKTYIYSTLTVGKPIHFKGHSRYDTVLKTNAATGNKIIITVGRECKFTDLTLDSSVTQTSGAYVYFYSDTYENYGSVFRDVKFANCYTGIDFVTCASWTIDRCYFVSYNTGIFVNNLLVPDNGGGFITNTQFDAGGIGSTGTAIDQRAAGGLQISNCGFLYGQYHYKGVFYSSSDTSILIFTNNTSEHASAANMYFSASGGTTFAKVLIESNQFTVNASSTGIRILNTDSNYLDSVLIGGNLLNLGSSAIGMDIGSGQRVVLLPNTFNGDGSDEYGICFGSGIQSTSVHRQMFYDLTSGFSGTMTNVTFNDAFTLKGSVSSRIIADYGTLFRTAPIDITFDTPFPKTPFVKVTATGIDGEAVSAIAGYITTTGFQMIIIGARSGGTVTADWEARIVN